MVLHYPPLLSLPPSQVLGRVRTAAEEEKTNFDPPPYHHRRRRRLKPLNRQNGFEIPVPPSPPSNKTHLAMRLSDFSSFFIISNGDSPFSLLFRGKGVVVVGFLISLF